MTKKEVNVKATIWHNPRCSKSREALAILHDAPGVEVEIVEYLKHPPTRETLARLYDRAGISPADGLRRNEPDARALAEADSETILDAMAQNPILIERPLVETPNGVRLGRPPERVRDLL